MSAKPLVTFWSKAAVDAAGESLARIQRTVRLECGEIAEQAGGWFVHVVEAGSEVAYLCNGRMENDAWEVWVQLAEYVAMDPLPDDHPHPPSRGKVVKMPQAAETPDNEAFAEIGYLEH